MKGVPLGDLGQVGEGEEPLPIEIPFRNRNERDGVLIVGRSRIHQPGRPNQMAMRRNVDEAHVLIHLHGSVKGGHLVWREYEWSVEVLGAHDGREYFTFDRFVGIEDVDRREVRLFHGRRTVVHLQQQVGICRNRTPDARWVYHGQCSRHPCSEE